MFSSRRIKSTAEKVKIDALYPYYLPLHTPWEREKYGLKKQIETLWPFYLALHTPWERERYGLKEKKRTCGLINLL